MGILYAGTSPDFCRFHGIPVDPARALEALLTGCVSAVDAVAIRYTDQAGQTQLAHFGCGCNVGLGASIARHANRRRPYVGDLAGTALSAIQAICATAPVDLVIDADGQSQLLPHVNNLSVLKNPWIASGLKLNVDLHPRDGRLAWVAIRGLTRLGLCRLLPSFYSGRAVHSPSVVMGRAGGIRIRAADTAAAQRVELEFDGDPRGFLPAAIELLPGALHLIGGGHA
jgi:diacylglycerol kinase (ATP)